MRSLGGDKTRVTDARRGRMWFGELLVDRFGRSDLVSDSPELNFFELSFRNSCLVSEGSLDHQFLGFQSLSSLSSGGELFENSLLSRPVECAGLT